MENPKHQRSFYFGIIFVIIGAVAFSAKAIFIKLAYNYSSNVDPLSLMTLRMVMALPFFLVIAFISQRNSDQSPLTTKDWIATFFLGIVGFYLASLLDFKGLKLISASLERLVLFLYPTFVVLLSAIFLKRKINRSEVFALLLSYVGILFVVINQFGSNSDQTMTGIFLIAGSALSFAVFLMGSGEMTKRIGTTRFTAYAMSISCLVTITHYGTTHGINIPEFQSEVYILAFLMAIISTIIPTFLMNAGIRRIGASTASIMSSIGPISTLIFAYFLLDEAISFQQMIGTVLVLIGIYGIGRAGIKKTIKNT